MRGGDPDPPPRKRGGGGALLAPSSQCVDGLLNPHPSTGGRAIWALEKRHTKKAHVNDMQRKRNANLIPGLGEQNVKNKPIFFVNLEHPGSENMQFFTKKSLCQTAEIVQIKIVSLENQKSSGQNPYTKTKNTQTHKLYQIKRQKKTQKVSAGSHTASISGSGSSPVLSNESGSVSTMRGRVDSSCIPGASSWTSTSRL